ncbi:GTP-binding protein [Listeria weihenstephanensis FSL R9-0317]|uniref:GTPase HflX n=1 Tax=Listeria weihenstephanensis TaxID=1006155 RepID=A0A1S7FUC6_9LIST|nr:GTPase HflX [Listeria weihenstephanensis]AQY51003.1 GTPase [Listeria weihenstephanensis]EUJ36418.1 GTP-binding protein [Listeria weihenstephanensis FSL R9-0317]
MERAILVGCELPGVTEEHFYYSMLELGNLAKTAQAEVVGEVMQKREQVHPKTFVGTGKIAEIAAVVAEMDVDVVLFNSELSATQVRNISEVVDARILDRTQLILDIFAMRAKTREGKLQVALAQYQYLLPRLSGQGISLSRLGGGIGTRGPGETKLEMDRRHIRQKMVDIKKQLEVVVQHRERMTARRNDQDIFRFGLIGYTNAGKSTLFNRLSDAKTLEENKLFATLDPTTRKFSFSQGYTALLTDTVGFIQDLPTTVVAAFRSTLEETANVDVLLHVVDSSNPDYLQHEQTVLSLLEDLDMHHIPVLTVYNKKDQQLPYFIPTQPNYVEVSALEESSQYFLKEKMLWEIKQIWQPYVVSIPASDGRMLHKYKQETVVIEEAFDETTESYQLKGYKARKEN